MSCAESLGLHLLGRSRLDASVELLQGIEAFAPQPGLLDGGAQPWTAEILQVLRRVPPKYWCCRGRRNVYVGVTQQMTIGLTWSQYHKASMPTRATFFFSQLDGGFVKVAREDASAHGLPRSRHRLRHVHSHEKPEGEFQSQAMAGLSLLAACSCCVLW